MAPVKDIALPPLSGVTEPVNRPLDLLNLTVSLLRLRLRMGVAGQGHIDYREWKYGA